MSKSKKITIILSTLIMLLLAFFIFIFSNPENVIDSPKLNNNPEIIFYASDSCYNCKEVKIMLSKYDNINVILKTIESEENYKELQKVATYFNKDAMVPSILIGDKFLVGADIIDSFDDTLNKKLGDKYELLDVSTIEVNIAKINEENYNNISFFVIMLSGLIDGINPCALSMLILLIGIVTKTDKKNVIYVGASYASGTFLAYFFIGLNIFKVMEIASKISWLIIVMYISIICMSLFIIYLNTKDFINIKKGKVENIKNQLSNNQKSKIYKYINKLTDSKHIVFYGFVLGIILTLLEFTCTGQVYIPTLSYMINSGEGVLPYIYLFAYNIMFIMPLIIVCIVTYITKETNKVMNLLYDKLGYIKLITNLIYVIIIVILTIRLTKIL